MRREKQQAILAEARIRESISRKERGEEWNYPGREEDFGRARRWRKERGQTLTARGEGNSYGRM